MERISFVSPINGDCLNQRDGKLIGEKLCISVCLKAESGRKLLLNEMPAKETENGRYLGVVEVARGKNKLIATDAESGESCEITVFFLADATKRFRVSSDDNILFLRDLNEHPERYPSVFDHPYLAVYKKAHDLYGAAVQLNLFYSTDDTALSKFANGGTYFDLSMMTDRYRTEFESNAEWFRFSFHAKSEFPNKPYQFAEAETIRAHCEKIHSEIERFAGKACISDSVTVHWGEATPACIQALRKLGYRSFMGYFEYTDDGTPLVAYNQPNERIDHIGARDFWFSEEENVLYGRIDLVLNLRTAEENERMSREISEHKGRGGFVSVMIHEQYFYEGYKKYLPDFARRVLEPCRILFEKGYKGVHIANVTEEVWENA